MDNSYQKSEPMTWDAWLTPGRLALLAAVMMAAILAVDLLLPLGVAGGVPYVAVVLLGWWFPKRNHIITLAAISTALTLIGYFYSPEGGIPWVVASNRLIALFAIWVSAGLLIMAKVMAKEAEERIKRINEDLEQRVEERTRELSREVAEHKRAEEALAAAKGEAETANRAKSEFLAAMSHDFRTPLNAILGFADILSHQYFGPIDDKYREYAEDIKASGEHLLTLVNDILDLSTIEAGKQSLVKEKLSTMEIITECERIVEDKARSHGIDLVTEVPEDLPPLYADRRASKQILLNLLSNAVKFTPQGGRITVSATASKKNTTLKIADTGKGIPPEKLPGLTDPFTRADADPYLTEPGWGLGLTITKSLVELHDGTLDIKSKVGKGTTVTVTLPNGAP